MTTGSVLANVRLRRGTDLEQVQGKPVLPIYSQIKWNVPPDNRKPASFSIEAGSPAPASHSDFEAERDHCISFCKTFSDKTTEGQE